MPIVFFMIAAAIALTIAAVTLVRRDDPYKTAATALNLKLTRSGPDLLPELAGIINGLPVRVDEVPRRELVVRYRVFYPDLGMALRLERETNVSRALGKLGERDTQLGTRSFDRSFRINTSRPDALRQMMTTDLRRSLEQLIEAYPQILIEDGAMTLVSESSQPTGDEIASTLIAMAAAAHLLSTNRPPPLTATSSRPAVRPPAVESQPMPPAPDHDPGTTTDANAAEPVAAEPPPASDSLPQRTDNGLPAGFFEAAFGTNRLSFEADKTFNDRLRGKTVTLTGPVKQTREVSIPAEQGDRLVTRVVVTVAEIRSELYGSTEIDAVVNLPPGLDLDRGDEITFRGRLEAIDPFMRNLTVADAERIDAS
jgi:hypothetical protein